MLDPESPFHLVKQKLAIDYIQYFHSIAFQCKTLGSIWHMSSHPKEGISRLTLELFLSRHARLDVIVCYCTVFCGATPFLLFPGMVVVFSPASIVPCLYFGVLRCHAFIGAPDVTLSCFASYLYLVDA